MESLAGKVAVVTGAASGIGAALCDALTRAGVNTVACDIDPEALTATAASWANRNVEILQRRIDVTDAAEMAQLAAEVERHFGAVDILFNNAGVLGSAAQIGDLSAADWALCLGVNLMGVVHGVEAFLPGMRRAGGDAHIVNVASIAGLMRQPRMAPYYASKSAVLAVSEVLALECSDDSVQVHIVCPGAVATQIGASAQGRKQQGDSAAVLAAFSELLSSTGMTPAELAEKIIQKMLAGDLYIITHPEHSDEIEQRLTSIIDALPRTQASSAL